MFLRKKVFLMTIVFCIAMVGIVAGKWTINAVNAQGDYEKLKAFIEAITLIERNYVEEVKIKDLVVGAIKGMVNSLDSHSGYLSPEAFREIQVESKGEFGGLGIQIGIRDESLTVIAPIEGTPAFRAGIKAGDKIVKISGESTKNIELYDAVTKMRGPKGTSITLSIFREGWEELMDFTIVRDIIKIKSVRSQIIKDDIGYIRLAKFQESTASDLAAALDSLYKEGMTSLILDLRNNPGGLLSSAVAVAEQFLPENKLVVYIKGRSDKKIEYFTEGKKARYTDIPMVVLINHGSASASEIVAGALKDWNRAVILGVQTFGKGSVQSLIPLSDGSGLRLTTAKYYTPSGTLIQDVGIIPDIVVKQETKDKEGHPIIREGNLERPLKNEQQKEDTDEKEAEPEIVVDEKDDVQLQRAIETLKTWRVFERMLKNAA